ncbi:MAG: S8 family serine peptidase [Blastocatellia bacterium]
MKRITSPRLTAVIAFLLVFHYSITTFAGITLIPGQGVVLTGADGLVITGADGVVLTGADGVVLTGADGVVLTGADGVVLTGADFLTYIGVEGVVLTGADSVGINSLDPELGQILDGLPDTSAINVFIAFHEMPAEADFNALRAAGILGGTRYRNLPIVLVNAFKQQIAAISALPSVRSIYSNKTLGFLSHDTRVITGQQSVVSDSHLTQSNNGTPLSGRGVTVAVIDTGIDATHPDLRYGSKVVQNVRTVDLQSIPLGFNYPIAIEGLSNTDLLMGHGTLVASLIAGTGAASNGYYGGMAPGAKLLGISAGDASLFFVLSAMDYVLSNRVSQNIRVVNCSFGTSGVFDANDPVNIATKIMHDSGISVVFSAGNRGDQPNSLNPYSVAPWVIGVGSGTKDRSLSSFSSRGAAGYSMFHPTLIAPGESIVGARSLGVNVVGTLGLANVLISPANDLQTIPFFYLFRYTNSSGTSFAAPHVSGTIALMLQANPALQVDDIKAILEDTATPMLGYKRYEVGAGYLNTYAAVRKAEYATSFGAFRAELSNPTITYTKDNTSQFSGAVAPGQSYSVTLDVPQDAASATVQVGWFNHGLIANNLNITASGPGQSVQSKPSVQLAGLSYKKTGVTINNPAPGQWTITVTNVNAALLGSSQNFTGAIELFHANMPAEGLDQLSPTEQQAVRQALITGLMTADGNFAAGSPATRLEVARAVMLGAGARIPQYLPYTPTYVDVPNNASALFVESVAHSPYGDLLNTNGCSFSPQGQADRLTVAIATVKAAGIDLRSSSNPGLADWSTIPSWARSYVNAAVSQGLMSPIAGYFRPFNSITRAELAKTAVALQQAAR